MANLVENGYKIFTDVDGDPLEDGYIYIGKPDLNPISNPINAFWDAALSIPATNIRTKGGYADNNGTPGRIYTETNYSILVRDKKNATVYTLLNSTDYYNSPSGNVVQQVQNIEELKNIIPTDANFSVISRGYYISKDVTDIPPYYWDQSSVEDDNGGSIIRPTDILSVNPGRWVWGNVSPIDVRWFGAKGDDSTDDTIAIRSALSINGSIKSAPGYVYRTSSAISFTGSVNINFYGSKINYVGIGGTALKSSPISFTEYGAFAPFSVAIAQRTITLPAGVTAVDGDIIIVESDDVSLSSVDGDYLKGQYLKITNANGQDVSFFPSIIENFTVDRIKVLGKTEHTEVRNLHILSENSSNNASLAIEGQSYIIIDNVTCEGTGTQNTGITANGVGISITSCTVTGINNGFTPLGYGINVHGASISIANIVGTNCRHCIDGSSRASYLVGVSVSGCKLNKGESDDSHFYYALGFHANSRGITLTDNYITGIGLLMAVRGGEATIKGNTFVNKYSNDYEMIRILEEGCRAINISDNIFLGDAATIVSLQTDQTNRNLLISNNNVKAINQIFFEYVNRGYDSRNIHISNNLGLIEKMFVDKIAGTPPDTNLEITFSNNEFEPSNTSSGYFLGFQYDYKNLTINLKGNDIATLTSATMFAIVGTIVGDLRLLLDSNTMLGSVVDSYFIHPVSVTGELAMTVINNEFDGQFDLDAPAGSYSPVLFAGNKAIGRDDPIAIIQTTIPILFRDNIVNDANNCRLWNTTLNKHTGNENFNGAVSINNLGNFSIKFKADGRWFAIDDTFLPAQGTWETGDIVYVNAPATGSPLGYVCTVGGGPGTTTWKPLANVN